MRDARVRIAVALDIAVIIVFVAIGRRNHDEGSAIGEVFRIAAPFLIGLAAGWSIARAWRHPMSLVTGTVIWIVTIAVGMALPWMSTFTIAKLVARLGSSEYSSRQSFHSTRCPFRAQ